MTNTTEPTTAALEAAKRLLKAKHGSTDHRGFAPVYVFLGGLCIGEIHPGDMPERFDEYCEIAARALDDYGRELERIRMTEDLAAAESFLQQPRRSGLVYWEDAEQ